MSYPDTSKDVIVIVENGMITVCQMQPDSFANKDKLVNQFLALTSETAALLSVKLAAAAVKLEHQINEF